MTKKSLIDLNTKLKIYCEREVALNHCKPSSNCAQCAVCLMQNKVNNSIYNFNKDKVSLDTKTVMAMNMDLDENEYFEFLI